MFYTSNVHEKYVKPLKTNATNIIYRKDINKQAE